MTSRVSPRSNASSASSSSTSSRRAYRNPTFGKPRDNFSSDPWVSDGTSAYSAKHQQHLSGGQRSQKSHQTGRDWRDSGPPVAKESENSLSWRSQKQAVNKYSNTAQSSVSHQPDDMYQPPRHPAQGQPAAHALKSQWSHVSPRQQSLAAQQGRPYFEDTVRGRRDPSTTRWNEDAANNVSLGKLKLPSFEVNHNQGYIPDRENHSNRGLQTSNFNQRSQLNCSPGSYQQGYGNNPMNSNHVCIDYSKKSLHGSEYSAETSVYQNHEESVVRRNQVKHRDHEYAITPNARGLGAKSDHFRPLEQRDGSERRHQEDRSYPPKLNPTSLGYFGNFSRVSGSSAESSVFRSQGDAEFQRHTATYRNHQNPDTPSTKGLEVRLDHFQALTIRDGDVPNTSFLPTNRHWEGVGPLVTSWADECCDNVAQTYEVQPKRVYNPYNTEWVDSDVATIRKPKHGNDSQCNLDTRVMDRDMWQENSRQVAPGTRSRLQNPKVGSKQAKQEASRKTGHAERKGSIKQSASIASDQVADKAGDFSKVRARSQNEASLGDIEGGQEAVTHANQACASPAETEVPEDMLPFIMGTCEDMCPVKEREQRERLRDLAVFERVNRNPSKTSRELAVKKFCRTLTGVKLLSVDVRPLRVLWNTQRYLLNLLDDTEFSFDILHNFLFDRTRAIRQELGMQRIANSQAVNMYEEIVRFHILSEHELNQRGSGQRVSDSHLNLQQLSKSLLSLFDLYRLSCNGKLANEAEFRAYYVLLNLDSSKNHQADSLSVWFRQFSAASLKSWELKFARSVLRCYRAGNYKTFFQLAEEATFLQSCLMEIHFNEVRLKALVAMNQGGYKLHPIPLADIAKQLLIKEGDLEELCNRCGLSAGMDTSKVRCLFVKQSQFSAPKELPSYRCPCIINKRPSSYFEEVTGTRQRL